MIWFLTIAVAAAAAQPGTDVPSLRVLIYDFAHMPKGPLAGAQQEAGRILRAAGVQLRWNDCPPGISGGDRPACNGLLAPSDLVVHILARRWLEFRVLRSGMGVPYEILGHALCVAENEGNYIKIYGKSALRMAAGSEKRLTLLLGYGIAHEIGHLLLGRHTTGIMAPEWAEKNVLAAPSDQFLFSLSDSSKLIERARKRVAAELRTSDFRHPRQARR